MQGREVKFGVKELKEHGMDMTTQAKLNIPKQPDTQFLWGWQYHQVIKII